MVKKVVAEVVDIANLEMSAEEFDSLPNMKETVGRSGVMKKLQSYLKTVADMGVTATRVNLETITGKSGASVDYYSAGFKEIRDNAKEVRILDIESVDGLDRKVKEFAIKF